MKNAFILGLAAVAVTVTVAALTMATPVAKANDPFCEVWYTTMQICQMGPPPGNLTNCSYAARVPRSISPSYYVDAADVGCAQALIDCYNAGYTWLIMDPSYYAHC